MYLGFLVQKAWLVKRVTQVLPGSLASWEVQENQASKGLQERWDLEDPGVSLEVEGKWAQKGPPASQVNWDLVGALAFLACLGPLDFLE